MWLPLYLLGALVVLLVVLRLCCSEREKDDEPEKPIKLGLERKLIVQNMKRVESLTRLKS